MMHLFKPKGKRCICCCFCDVCPWAVFLLLHILFSAEQFQDFLHNLCSQGGECNIYCCFFDACPWAVFLLLHILFSTEQILCFCIICAYKWVIVIYVAVSISVLYVHGLYLFCWIFCFLQNRSLFTCIYAYRVVMCLYMYFPFIKYLH